jgi:L-threonylcarbamoyladenylate synthase
VHLADAGMLRRWVNEVPEAARRLAARFWPGPLTLVMTRAADVDDSVTGGQDTVAIRVPSHPVAQRLLAAFGGGIAAPSANRYGRLSPTCAGHVQEELGDAVQVIVDGGECQIGLESTIVSCTGREIRLLRPGVVTAAQIREVVGDLATGADLTSPRVPGSTLSHYAPATALTVVPADELDARVAALCARGQRLAVLARRPAAPGLDTSVTWIDAGGVPGQYGHDLYANLRTLDKAGCARIVVQDVPAGEVWDAIRDRLRRAAHGVHEGA